MLNSLWKSDQISGREIIDLLNRGEIPPRVPFVPVIYEHAAVLVSSTPSKLAVNKDILVEAQLAAYKLYKQDLVYVGADIYNIEAEALGCKVAFYNDFTVPSITGPIVSGYEDFKNLRLPDPLRDGRMPLFISATKTINEIIGNEVYVNGTIVGPFTLAAVLRGFESLLMDFIFDEKFAKLQMEFATEVCFSNAKSFIDAGTGVAINESWIAPPLLSPELFELQVQPYEKKLISRIKSCGLKTVAFVCGGNTSSIAELLVQTGTSFLMADANSNQAMFKKICEEHNINLRAGISPALLENGDFSLMETAVKTVIKNCAANGRFIMGCGVVSADTPPDNVLKFKQLVEKYNPYILS